MGRIRCPEKDFLPSAHHLAGLTASSASRRHAMNQRAAVRRSRGRWRDEGDEGKDSESRLSHLNTTNTEASKKKEKSLSRLPS